MLSENDPQPDQAPEPKIIVDEDWKTQVEREKEELRNPKTAEATASPAGKPPSQASKKAGSPQLPPASLMVLVSTLATQAMAGLGILPDPVTGQPNVNLPLAKHFIDSLAMLEEKTKGNLSDDEAAQIRDSLHQLRMIYLSAPPTTTEKPAEPVKSTLELP